MRRGGSVSGLVPAAGGGAGNHEWLPELAGSGTLLLKEKAVPTPSATTLCSLRRWVSSSGARRRIPRSANSSTRWMWRPYALPFVTERSPRSQVGHQISISWCVTARRYGSQSSPRPVRDPRLLPRSCCIQPLWVWRSTRPATPPAKTMSGQCCGSCLASWISRAY
jgi:hypothetical protein